MTLLVVSFLAGVLTVLAPCILPLLPVIVGGSLVSSGAKRSVRRPLTIVMSLAVSLIIFTLLLKATTTLLGVPQVVWNGIAGGIVLLFGLTLIWPELWERLMVATNLNARSTQLMSLSSHRTGTLRDVLIGASLGPVFSSCSPTYALIVAVVLPQSFATGLGYLAAYAIGLAAALLLISLAGRALLQKLGWLSNPHGWFRRGIGGLFLVVGVGVIFGLDRQLQAFILDQGWYDPIMFIEMRLGF